MINVKLNFMSHHIIKHETHQLSFKVHTRRVYYFSYGILVKCFFGPVDPCSYFSWLYIVARKETPPLAL